MRVILIDLFSDKWYNLRIKFYGGLFMSKNPIKPFWSWNDKLEKAELEEQIGNMHKAGIEGFFMHARGGLVTEYMSEEWFSMIEACLDKADELNMEAWAYDENGWPSGFADGIVPQTSPDYQQKWLCVETVNDINETYKNVIGFYKIENGKAERLAEAIEGCIVIFYDVNIYYIDTFNPDAIDCFIENTHEKYYERFGDRFGSSLKGFFTDEPQYGRDKYVPWSTRFELAFKEIYGYDLIENLPKLYYKLEGYEAFRSDFYNMVSDLFRETFMKKMYDWCTDHNCKLTGHMMEENGLFCQMHSTAGVMSCYEYFHEPGIDWLGRLIGSPLTPKQLGSAAYQLGRKTLTESFALCGWDVSLNELKWIAGWQAVNGVTMLCPHLEGYTLRGERKRDYPASLSHQLPWFDDAYPAFADYSVKLGELLDSGKDVSPLLVLNMIQSAYIVNNTEDYSELFEMDKKLDYIVRELSGLHILHHYGDEVLMSHLAKIENGKLQVGLCEYEAVLLPSLLGIKSSTAKLLNDYIDAGGKVYIFGEAPIFVDGRKNELLNKISEKSIHIKDLSDLKKEIFADFVDISTNGSENGNIHYCEKKMPDGRTLYYLVNLAKEPQSVTLRIKGDYSLNDYNVTRGEETTLNCNYEDGYTVSDFSFAEYGSIVITANEVKSESIPASNVNTLKLNKEFEICECSENSITLDACEYSINGGEWKPKKAVILIQKELLALKEVCDVSLRFKFNIEKGAKIGNIALCVENPEKFEFIINGNKTNFNENGYFVDKSIKKSDISSLVVEGENEIIMNCNFYQRQKVYDVLFLPNVHEVERNKLTFDTELESIYLVGDFGVTSGDDFTLGDKKSIFTGQNFALTSPIKNVDINNITVQGYWFFAGKMSLKQNVLVQKEHDERYIVSLKELYSPAAELFVNGKKAGIFAFAPYVIDVTDLLENGENEIIIRLLSGNRNLLGPHHRYYGESHLVAPSTFTDQHDWDSESFGNRSPWTDDYSFVLFGARI